MTGVTFLNLQEENPSNLAMVVKLDYPVQLGQELGPL